MSGAHGYVYMVMLASGMQDACHAELDMKAANDRSFTACWQAFLG